MTQIEQTSTPPDIAVVLNDPFQSQDAFRRTATAFRIKRCGDRCGQVIVLSHDAGFLKQVWELLPSDERKALHLHSAGRTTVLAEWNICEHLKETLQADIYVIQRFLDLGEGKPRDVAQKLRPILEGYCKNFCPGQFADTTMMGDIIRTIRSSGYDHPLFAALNQIEEFNEYARRHHHAPNASANFEPLNEGELRSYCYRLLQFMKVRREYNEPQML